MFLKISLYGHSIITCSQCTCSCTNFGTDHDAKDSTALYIKQHDSLSIFRKAFVFTFLQIHIIIILLFNLILQR
jgi:hypothetical protein